MQLNRYHWGMTVGAAGLVGLAAYPVYDFLVRHENEYEAAGSFFNFAYGVPIAALSAVVTLALAWVGHTIAGQQGDIEILKFVEERVRPALDEHRKLAVALGESARIGDRAEEISSRILDCLPTENTPNLPFEQDLFIDILGELSARSDAVGIDAVLAAHADDIQRWAVSRSSLGKTEVEAERAHIERALTTVGRAVQTLHAAICSINDAFDGISNNLYAAMFSRAALKAHAPGGVTPVSWLKERLAGQNLLPDLLEDSLPDINGNLRRLSEQTVARELVTAVLKMPPDASAIEIVGSIMLTYDTEAPEPPKVSPFANANVRRMRFNLGAAYYLTAFLYIPGPETVRETFRDLLRTTSRERRQVAIALLDMALPERSELGIARLAKIMTLGDDALNRLIVVEQRGGAPEFYSPTQHGQDIWRSHAKAEAPFFSVRRLLNRRR